MNTLERKNTLRSRTIKKVEEVIVEQQENSKKPAPRRRNPKSTKAKGSQENLKPEDAKKKRVQKAKSKAANKVLLLSELVTPRMNKSKSRIPVKKVTIKNTPITLQTPIDRQVKPLSGGSVFRTLMEKLTASARRQPLSSLATELVNATVSPSLNGNSQKCPETATSPPVNVPAVSNSPLLAVVKSPSRRISASFVEQQIIHDTEADAHHSVTENMIEIANEYARTNKRLRKPKRVSYSRPKRDLENESSESSEEEVDLLESPKTLANGLNGVNGHSDEIAAPQGRRCSLM